MIAPETRSLMEAARLGDNDACSKLLEDNAGLIWSVVRRYSRRNVELDDLYQLGCLGFLKAVRGFEPEYGTQFSTYAVPKIAGEIRRFLRDDGIVKVSRGIKERAVFIRQARDRLQSALDREPSLSELSMETGIPMEEIAATDIATASVTSLHAESSEGGPTLESVLGCDGPEDHLLEHMDLHAAIGSLPERERKIVFLRYYKGLTQDKTAKIMGISQVQVSRVEKKAIVLLRQALEPE
ncbi:MAG: polymerase sporulation specific sigma factor SigF [Firmicutes bacterium]|nr:polymerase sporulation specific sigma factor SigF [Bacillota bacterium]